MCDKSTSNSKEVLLYRSIVYKLEVQLSRAHSTHICDLNMQMNRDDFAINNEKM